MVKLGSLFDGSGGFPLAGSLCGIEPVWASEVEPYPISVTNSRFPNMKHLGSVTDVHGGDIEPVDIITFGSPCQDLSVAGKRAGLKHEANGDDETTRSGLFMEAVRIIKEMREATHGEYPTFAVWENVPGAFSSNKGEDFRTVLEELIKIVEPTAVMPAVPKNGWPYADSYCGDGWSLAYRVFDAQYWGVPQRRRRIYLVLDLRGQRAGKVSFEREGLRGNFTTFKTSGQGTAGDAADRTGADDCEGVGLDIYNFAVTGDIAASLTTATGLGASNTGPTVAVPYTLKIRSGCEGGGKGDRADGGVVLYQPMSLREENWAEGDVKNAIRAGESKSSHCVVQTLPFDTTQVTSPQIGVCYCAGFKAGNGSKANGIGWQEECAPTISAAPSGTNQAPTVCVKCYDEQPIVFDKKVYGTYQNTGIGWWNESPVGATVRTPCGGDSTLANVCVEKNNTRYIVRRITPTECARLQGFPDDWGHPEHKEDFTEEEYRFWLNVSNTHAAINGKPKKDYNKAQMLSWYNKLHTDSGEYKMYGNGIALPCALYVMQGIKEVLIHDEMESDNRIRK